jgi:hypothetical protein
VKIDVVTPLDFALASINLERKLELFPEDAFESQLADEIIHNLPSSEPLRAIVESARRKVSIP